MCTASADGQASPPGLCLSGPLALWGTPLDLYLAIWLTWKALQKSSFLPPPSLYLVL